MGFSIDHMQNTGGIKPKAICKCQEKYIIPIYKSGCHGQLVAAASLIVPSTFRQSRDANPMLA